MANLQRYNLRNLVVFLLLTLTPAVVAAQDTPVILSAAQLTRVVPTSFYFEGQSAPTQMRNAAAARLGENRHIIAGLVDTSGYSADVRAKYEGFLITAATITIGGRELGAGAYGFGFSDDGKMNIYDVGGTQLMTVDANHDKVLRRPRPLMMMKGTDGLRLYAGRNYVTIVAK